MIRGPKEQITIDKVIGSIAVTLLMDSVIGPALTGRPLHEYLGLPSLQNYRVGDKMTALMVEQGLACVGTLYSFIMEVLRYKRNG